MLCLAIHVYESSRTAPSPAIRIPLGALSIVSSCIPGSVKDKLAEKGVDLDHIISAAENSIEPGILLEIEDENDRLVIAIEPFREKPADQHENAETP